MGPLESAENRNTLTVKVLGGSCHAACGPSFQGTVIQTRITVQVTHGRAPESLCVPHPHSSDNGYLKESFPFPGTSSPLLSLYTLNMGHPHHKGGQGQPVQPRNLLPVLLSKPWRRAHRPGLDRRDTGSGNRQRLSRLGFSSHSREASSPHLGAGSSSVCIYCELIMRDRGAGGRAAVTPTADTHSSSMRSSALLGKPPNTLGRKLLISG